MKKRYLSLGLLLCSAAFAQSDTVIRWRGMEGLITAPGVNNPVGPINSGAGPWTVRSGSARINLTTGEGSFDVEGLVTNGGAASGTPGTVTTVVGTLVCNPSNAAGSAQAAIDTPIVNLSSNGDAELSFKLSVPPSCESPLFLIRTPSGRWIATATKPATDSRSRY